MLGPTFPGPLSSFFSLIKNEILEQASRQEATEEPRKALSRVSKDENPQRENEMDSPSFEGFHAQLDCQVTKGNKAQTQLTLV